jgi:hypothetical protein
VIGDGQNSVDLRYPDLRDDKDVGNRRYLVPSAACAKSVAVLPFVSR